MGRFTLRFSGRLQPGWGLHFCSRTRNSSRAFRIVFFQILCGQPGGARLARSAALVEPKRISKWTSLCERIAKLRNGESIVLEPEGDPAVEALKIRNGLNRVAACVLVRRSIRVVNRKIVITRVGMWRRPT